MADRTNVQGAGQDGYGDDTNSQQPAGDWFEQNKPQPPAANAGTDWFTANAPQNAGKGPIDLDAIAAKHGGVDATPAGNGDPRAKIGQYVMDTVSNIPSSAGKFLGGIANAVMHPVDTAGNALKTVTGLAQQMTPSTPGQEQTGIGREYVPYAEAVENNLKQRYGGLSNIANTIKTDPVGTAADVATVAGGVSGLARGASLAADAANLPRVAGTAGRVADTAATVSDAANPLIAAGKAIGKGVSAVMPDKVKPAGLYASALKIPPRAVNVADRDAIIQTGLREGIPVSRGGYEEAGNRIDDLNQQIAEGIASKSDELGPVIKPSDVAQRMNQVQPKFANQVNPDADLATLARSKKEFLDKHTDQAPFTKIEPSEEAGGFIPVGKGTTPVERPMTLAEAQAEKQGTYRQLKSKAYGELKGADIEAQKNLARGLKEEIVKQYPEIAALNQRDSTLIALEDQLARFVGREGNKNVIGLIPAVVGTAANNPAKAMKLFSILALDSPGIKSKVAIALERAKRLSKPAGYIGRGLNAGGVADELLPPGPLPPQ